MDVQQWLQNTADGADPNHEEGLGFPDFLLPRSKPDQPTRRYHRKRKRVSSDSSIIEPRRPHHKPDGVAYEWSGAGQAAARPHSLQSSGTSSPEPEKVLAKTYERRARHKTKSDRYEPKSRKPHEAHDDPPLRAKRRKSHRSGDGGRTTGLVQSFQLKNGPKNSRLTLKPEATAGLFKHGRTSVQVAGRGAGLPDLAFNELRFLQRPKDHQDEQPRGGLAQPPTKKTRERRREEEISAYFSTKRRANENIDAEREPPVAKSDKRATLEAQVVRQSKPQGAEPQAELHKRPFLGFGSKGIQSESKELRPGSDSFYTWSPSSKHPSVLGHVDHTAEGRDRHGSVPPEHRRRTRPSSEADIQAHSKPSAIRPLGKTFPSHHSSERSASRPIRQVKGGAAVELHQPPPALVHSDGRRRRSATKTTLQSLPRLPTTERLRQTKELPKSQVPRTRVDSYHTSDILIIQPVDDNDPLSPQQLETEKRDYIQAYEKENINPRSSTPTGKLLRQAWDATAGHTVVEVSAVPTCPQLHDHTVSMRPPVIDYGEEIAAEAKHTGTTPTAFVQDGTSLESYNSRAVKLSRQRTATTYPTAAGPKYIALPPQPFPTLHKHMPNPLGWYEDDDDMLDDGAEVEPLQGPYYRDYANSRQAGGPVLEVATSRPETVYQLQAAYDARSKQKDFIMPSHAAKLFEPALEQVMSGSAPSTPSVHSSPGASLASGTSFPLRRHARSRGPAVYEHDEVAGDEVEADNDLAGFWKPHRLY